MIIPLLFRANLVSLTCGAWLAIAVCIALLTACGGGDPEPTNERERIPARPASEAAQ